MLRIFIEARPRRMEESSIHVYVHDSCLLWSFFFKTHADHAANSLCPEMVKLNVSTVCGVSLSGHYSVNRDTFLPTIVQITLHAAMSIISGRQQWLQARIGCTMSMDSREARAAITFDLGCYSNTESPSPESLCPPQIIPERLSNVSRKEDGFMPLGKIWVIFHVEKQAQHSKCFQGKAGQRHWPLSPLKGLLRQVIGFSICL